MSASADRRAVAVRVAGRVQGVGVRWSAAEAARRLGVAGWVRNEPDGSVRALVQGPSPAVEAMLAWLRGGLPAPGWTPASRPRLPGTTA